MAGKRRITAEQEQQIIEAYLAWEPGASAPTVQEIADRHGVTKQTLYHVLARNGIQQKSARGNDFTANAEPWKETAAELLSMLIECRLKLAAAEAQLATYDNVHLADN